jgi:hypothetical protein
LEVNMSKKTIRYYGLQWGSLEVGNTAFIVLAESHPNCNTPYVRTSTILSVEPNGNFETLNTHYVKVKYHEE